MHVDFDWALRAGYAFENGSPEIVAAFRNPAFTVHPEGDPLNLGTGFKQQRQCVATIQGVGLWRESLNMVVGMRAVGPLVGVSPQTELELETASRGFFPDEAQHFEIALAL